jgi:hypothetical protein
LPIDTLRSGRPVNPDRLGIVVETDRQVTPFACHARPDDLGLLAADEVDGNVGTTSIGPGIHLVEEVVACGVIDGRGAEFGTQPHLFGSAGNRDHLGARCDTELDHRRPDRTRSSDDEQRLTRGQLRALVQCEVADVEWQREGRCSDVVELGRRIEGSGDRRDGVLGQSAKGLFGHGDDPAAHPLGGTFTGLVHHAADVHAEREGHLTHDARDRAAAPGDVPEVERAGRDRDPYLAGSGLWNRNILNCKRFRWSSVTYHLKSLQPSTSCRAVHRCTQRPQ